MLPELFSSVFSKTTSRGEHSTSTIALPMLLSSIAPFGISGLTSGSALASAFLVSAPVDPTVEAQVLTDMSHLGLDLAGFLGPGMIVLRLAAVAGRLCTMAADYVPDHTILPEEMVFQLCMLTAAWVALVKAALLPAFAASASKVTVKDGRAFTALFAPAGISWTDFKALSVCALDWITVEAGETVTTDEFAKEDEYIYWLYSGNVQVESEGTTLYNVSRFSRGASNLDGGRGLLGERRLLRRLEQSNKKNSKSDTYPRTTVRATSAATLLRIHTPNLKLLMDNDQKFANSIRTLLFQGMEAKLTAQLQEATLLLKTFNVTKA